MPVLAPKTHRYRSSSTIVNGIRRFNRDAARRKTIPTQIRMEELDDAIILTLRQSTLRPCNPKYLRYFCRNRKHVFKQGCKRKDCPTCSDEVLKRRSARIFKRFELGRKNRPILYTTLTVPVELRDKYQDRLEWRKVVKAVIAHFKKHLAMEFGVEQSHPISEDHPWRFHPHINLLWIRKPGYGAQLDLDELRSFWATVLHYDKEPVVWHEFAAQKRVNKQTGEVITVNMQIKHLCNYVARPFPGYGLWLGSIRWYGGKAVPKLPDEIHVCPCCGEAYLFDGFSDGDEYLENITRYPKHWKPPHEARDDFLPNWN
jgi:hypothetical protein